MTKPSNTRMQSMKKSMYVSTRERVGLVVVDVVMWCRGHPVTTLVIAYTLGVLIGYAIP